MATDKPGWNDVRGKGFFVAVLLASVLTYTAHAIYVSVTAKTPGDTHCYGNVCHRVFALDEARRMIGQTVDVVATHYDAPGVDKYNVGQYTSSGEEFDAENPARAAAANFPDGTELLIWHPGTRRAAHIRVNDFGPFMGTRTLDVTRKVAENMGWAKNGVATLKVTVIWVQPSTDPRYRKGRIYPPSLGLIGVVEAHQYGAVVDNLIATAAARNGQGPGERIPDIAAVVASLPTPPPSFRSEGVDEADERADEKYAALAAMQARLPLAVTTEAPYVDPIYTQPPAFVPEPIVEAPAVAHAKATAIANAIASLPPPAIGAELPAELLPPIVVALARPPAEVDAQSAQPPSPLPVQAETVSASTQSVQSAPDEGVPSAANRSSLPGVVVPQVELPRVVTSQPAATVVVAAARVPAVAQPWHVVPPVYWIGIILMLSTLWGAASLTRSRRRGGAMPVNVAVQASPLERTLAVDSDVLDVARRSAETAEGRARYLLTEAAQTPATDEREIAAREDLARELALREFEREHEAATRARAEAAATAHLAAQRDLAALEEARARLGRGTLPSSGAVSAQQSARVMRQITPAAVVAPVVPAPARSRATAQEMARFPGLKDEALVGAIIGLPGAARYWGNTIIAGMKLEGSARSGSPMRVDGSVEGACLAPVLLISEGAAVSGVIAAETIIVLGRVEGVVSGRNVIVASTAQVEGEVFYQSISIDPQAHCDVSFSRLALEQDPVDVGATVYNARAA